MAAQAAGCKLHVGALLHLQQHVLRGPGSLVALLGARRLSGERWQLAATVVALRIATEGCSAE